MTAPRCSPRHPALHVPVERASQGQRRQRPPAAGARPPRPPPGRTAAGLPAGRTASRAGSPAGGRTGRHATRALGRKSQPSGEVRLAGPCGDCVETLTRTSRAAWKLLASRPGDVGWLGDPHLLPSRRASRWTACSTLHLPGHSPAARRRSARSCRSRRPADGKRPSLQGGAGARQHQCGDAEDDPGIRRSGGLAIRFFSAGLYWFSSGLAASARSSVARAAIQGPSCIWQPVQWLCTRAGD